MRVPRTQRYRVRLADGSEREVCCGPAVPAGVVAYTRVGEAREGLCHHNPALFPGWGQRPPAAS